MGTDQQIRIKRIYQSAESSDGRRILIDRLWPRGLSKAEAKIDFWARSVAPSHELRRWYQHDPVKWDEFRRRYFAELEGLAAEMETLLEQMGQGVVTFLFSSKEERLNNAAALAEYVTIRQNRE